MSKKGGRADRESKTCRGRETAGHERGVCSPVQLSPSAPPALYTESFHVQVPESSTESRTHKEPSQPRACEKVTQSIASLLPASSCW